MELVLEEQLPTSGNDMEMGMSTFQTILGLLFLAVVLGVEYRPQFITIKPEVLLWGGLGSGIVIAAILQNVNGVIAVAFSILTASILGWPLKLMKLISGQDFKVFLALSVFLDWQTVFLTLACTMLWASIIGVVQVYRKHQLSEFRNNILSLTRRQKLDEQKVHTVSFNLSLMLGGLSILLWTGVSP